MKRALAFLLLVPLLAAARDLPVTVREALARAGVPDSAVAAVVVPVERGAPPLVAHNPEQPLNPASVMKLVTTYAALDLLGPAFTFKTDFLATAELSSGVLEGDLHIKGGGDPKLTADRLWLAVHELRSRGVREIRGDIVIDRSWFAPAPFDPAKFDNDPRRAYNAGADAFLVNFHAVEFRFVPEASAVRVVPQPDLPNIEIVSRIRPVPGPCTWWRGDLKHQFIENGLIATAVFEGNYPVSCGENSWALSVFDGPRFAESVLRWVWSEAGGKLRGKVRDGRVPADARLLMRVESEPLSNLVRDMNKFSNNVMARHMFLALSAQRSGSGEIGASARIVREWLAARAIDAPGFVIDNGAGLSRDDRITAGTVAALLQRAWATPLMPEIASSMPVFATDGTLRKRVGPAAGQAHLKGGTLTGVQSVAGYVIDRSGRRWVLVMIVNHAKANAAQPALDALVAWVHEGNPTSTTAR